MSKTGADAANEDQIVITDDFIGVIDGSTSKTDKIYANCTPGRRAALLVAETISRLPPFIDAHEAVQLMTRRIASEYAAIGVVERLENHPVERMTASFAIYSGYRAEIWLLGDVPFMVDGKANNTRKAEEEQAAAIRAKVLRKRLQEGVSVETLQRNDPGRKEIMPFLKAYMQEQNQPGGYGVIDGFPVPGEFIRVLACPEAREIVLASDGYPELFPTLAASEGYLHKIIKNDPLLISDFKATKAVKPGNQSFDDRSYVRFLTL